jgi:hypothetical protein
MIAGAHELFTAALGSGGREPGAADAPGLERVAIMHIAQHVWDPTTGWCFESVPVGAPSASLVLVFGETSALDCAEALDVLRDHHPDAHCVGCSTAGEIAGTRVYDGSIVATAISFEHTVVEVAHATIDDVAHSAQVARALAGELVARHAGLRHVLVLSDGLKVNGSELAAALRAVLPAGVSATGGLAGDGDRFTRTTTLADGVATSGQVVAVGLYGAALRVGWGSLGGWDPFGPWRRITMASGNVLHELDGQSALALYKSYLGEHAAGLPASALLFPLALDDGQGGCGLVRTVLAVDEASGTMTFAGDLPVGVQARLMKANFDRLVDGASGAAQAGAASLQDVPAQLALLISCVGRKLVLRQRIEEETEAVHEALGPQARLCGFYSYGEICPQGTLGTCELHNQTMTVTTLSEA